MKFKASEIAELVCVEVEGNNDVIIHDFSKIEQGREGTLTFLANPKYEEFIYNTKASVALVNKDFTPSQPLPTALTLIRVENAYEKLAHLLSLYNEFKSEKKGIENPSFIDPSATIGKDVYIGAFSYLGPNVKIGDGVQIHPGSYVGANSTIDNNVILFPGVKIYHNIQIGKYCVLHAGAVVGSDGFGFAPNSSNEYKKIPQYQLLFPGMSLDEFKYIFFWEYFHRLLGRIIGLFFIIPLLYFTFTGTIKINYLYIFYFVFF